MEVSGRPTPAPLDPNLLRKLDVCRPTGDDLAQLLTDDERRTVAADSRYAEWRQRSAAFDSAVGRTFGATPLPEGLEVRLRAALAQGAAEAGLTFGPAAPKRSSRRMWLATAGSALTATAAGFALFAWLRGREQVALTTDQLLQVVLELHAHTEAQRAMATPVSRVEAPADFPLSLHVVPEAEPRWRRLDTDLAGRSGALYELAHPGQPRAVLYVVPLAGDRHAPPLPPLSTDVPRQPESTGGKSLGFWTEGDRMYVLVVDGDLGRYRRFIERAQAVA